MQTRFLPPWRLSLAFFFTGFCGVSFAQEDQFTGSPDFPESLACPAPLEPAEAEQGTSAHASGTLNAQGFDYSLVRKKRQQLATQQWRSDGPVSLEFLPNEPQVGPLTGRQKKLLTRAVAADAARFAELVTNLQQEEPAAEEYYRSVPEQPEPEEPTMPMPPLSTALSDFHVPMLMQNVKATTGLTTDASTLASAADRHAKGKLHHVSGGV